MSEIINQSLQKIAKGTGIIFFGTIIGMLLGFAGQVLLTRYFTQSEYGIFSLALVIFDIGVMISLLGLQEGSARQIAYYRGKNNALKVKEVITSALQMTIIASILLSVTLFFTSGIISTNIFHKPELFTPLKIFSIAIPFFVLIYILTSIFQGFGEIKPKVYFMNLLRYGLFLLLLAPVILLGFGFMRTLYAFSGSIIITCIAFVVYAKKDILFSVRREKHLTTNPIRKELLFFSLPLLGFGISNMIMAWTDTMMLSYFKTLDVVGLYNAALLLPRFIPIVATCMVFIYKPIMTQLYSQDLIAEMKRCYATLTKWSFAVALPLFLVLFLFPTIVLDFFFGTQYVSASGALQILSLGFIIQAFLGFTGSTLIVMGRTKVLLWTSLVGGSVNVLLNAFLIPRMGTVGAAIAFSSALTLTVAILLTRIYQISGIHPFTRNYLKPIPASVCAVAIIYFIITKTLVVAWWMLPIFFILCLIIYGVFLVLTKSFDNEDLRMLLEIERSMKIDLSPIKKVLRRFI